MTRGGVRAVVEVDKVTGRVVCEYPAAVDADRALGLREGSTAHHAKRRHVASGPTVFRYKDEYDPHEGYGGRNNVPVAVYDRGRLLGAACDAQTLADRLCVHVSAILRRIEDGEPYRKRYELVRFERMGEYPQSRKGRGEEVEGQCK